MFFLDALCRVKSSTAPLTHCARSDLVFAYYTSEQFDGTRFVQKVLLSAAQKFSGVRYNYNDCLRL